MPGYLGKFNWHRSLLKNLFERLSAFNDKPKANKRKIKVTYDEMKMVEEIHK